MHNFILPLLRLHSAYGQVPALAKLFEVNPENATYDSQTHRWRLDEASGYY